MWEKNEDGSITVTHGGVHPAILMVATVGFGLVIYGIPAIFMYKMLTK